MNNRRQHIAPMLQLILSSFFVIVVDFQLNSLKAQELEPRLLSNIPIGTNFIGLSYSFAAGNIVLDQALPIENLQAKVNTGVATYVHAFNLYGKSAKVNVSLPWAYGNWSSYYENADTSTWRMGIADPRILLTINLFGAPAMDKKAFQDYRQKTIVGLSLLVLDPLGTYYSDKLINLGSNRWTCRPLLGVSHKSGKWFYEAYIGVWIFGHNPNFLNGNRLTQKPLITSKIHAIRSFKNKIWIGLGAGYGYGGQTALNNELSDFHISTLRFGALISIPIKEQHSFKIRFDTGIAIKEGADFDAASIVYQYRWGKREKKESQNQKNKDFYSLN